MENISGSYKPVWIRRKSDGKLYNVPSHQLESRLAEKNELGKEIYERVPANETPEALKKRSEIGEEEQEENEISGSFIAATGHIFKQPKQGFFKKMINKIFK